MDQVNLAALLTFATSHGFTWARVIHSHLKPTTSAFFSSINETRLHWPLKHYMGEKIFTISNFCCLPCPSAWLWNRCLTSVHFPSSGWLQECKHKKNPYWIHILLSFYWGKMLKSCENLWASYKGRTKFEMQWQVVLKKKKTKSGNEVWTRTS